MSDAIELLAAYDPFASAGADAGAPATLSYVLLDVFTEAPLEGNQLAVLTDAREVSEQDMQRLAHELKLSETVFVHRPRGEGDVRIRIFTPEAELPFAGHPVLGCAVVVGAALRRSSVTLETQVGEVSVTLRPLGRLAWFGWMRQPIPTWRGYEREAELLRALGVESSGLPVEVYDNGPRHVYVELGSERDLAALDPDMRALAALGEVGISCFAGAGARWKARVFAPALGIPEDPATGSAAGPLVVHLARHARVPFGEEIEIRQGEEIGRPSVLHARAEGSPAALERVEVGGAAVLVARGELLAPA